MAAQSAAQMSALFVMMRLFEKLQTARRPNKTNQPTTTRQPARLSVLDVDTATGAPFSCFPLLSAPTHIPHVDVYVTLVATSQANTQITAPLALQLSRRSWTLQPTRQASQTCRHLRHLRRLLYLTTPGAAALAPNPPILQSLQPNLQYTLKPLQ